MRNARRVCWLSPCRIPHERATGHRQRPGRGHSYGRTIEDLGNWRAAQRRGDKGGGSIAEALIIAKDKRGGAAVSGWGIDETNPAYGSTAIDYLRGDHEMVQVALSLSTLEDKIAGTNLAAMCLKIKKACFLEPERKFIFKYLDKNGAVPSANFINRVNGSLPPHLWVGAENFVPVQSIP